MELYSTSPEKIVEDGALQLNLKSLFTSLYRERKPEVVSSHFGTVGVRTI